MKGLLAGFILICVFKFSHCCRENGDTKCKNNSDCCSGNCDRPPIWEHGVCVPGFPSSDGWGKSFFLEPAPPASESKPSNCQDGSFFTCYSDTDCCSGFCDRNNGSPFGVCKQRGASETTPTISPFHMNPIPEPKEPQCKDGWFFMCSSDTECCSGFCSKNAQSPFGVCKRRPENTPTPAPPTPTPVRPQVPKPKPGAPQCDSDWSTMCSSNKQCCSGYCEKKRRSPFGICKPKPEVEPGPELAAIPEPVEPTKCKPESVLCSSSTDCCSGFCKSDPVAPFGTCQKATSEVNKIEFVYTKPVPGLTSCENDGFDACNFNNECCSDFCDKIPDAKFGVCKPKRCEPLSNRKLQITCYTSDGTSTPCDKPVPSNSSATFSCNTVNYMKIAQPAYNTIHCRNGIWDPPLLDYFCHAECGRAVVRSHQPAIAYGNHTEYGEFPWHAGIYKLKRDSNTYEYICGATLISHDAVITAAHCVSKERKNTREIEVRDPKTLKIGVGKFHRNFDAPEDDMAQIVDVKNIEISPQYLGDMALFANDIAMVTLKTEVEYSRAVQPVCVDIGADSFEEDQLLPGMKGKVVGWGLTEDRKYSDTLMVAEMPFVPKQECVSTVGRSLLTYVVRDKLCAGDKNSTITVCNGDSGGGLVFENPDHKAYYLRGIVSLGPRRCKGMDYALFTKVSSHTKMLEKYVRWL